FESRVGKTVRAIVDRELPDGSLEGRTIWQAPEIDGITVLGSRIEDRGSRTLTPGSFVDATILSVVDDYDLNASVERVVEFPRSSILDPRFSRRQLPLASIGAYGR